MTVEASLTRSNFACARNNFGSFPRGIAAMLRSLKAWLYDRDPLAPLAFEAPLRTLKNRITGGERYFENLIAHYLLDNPHRTTLTLRPDPEQAEREAAAERQRLDAARAAMSRSDLEALVDATCTLKHLQETPDPPEALATIPTLALKDLPRRNKVITIEVTREADTQVLYRRSVHQRSAVSRPRSRPARIACRPPAICLAIRESASGDGRPPAGFREPL